MISLLYNKLFWKCDLPYLILAGIVDFSVIPLGFLGAGMITDYIESFMNGGYMDGYFEILSYEIFLPLAMGGFVLIDRIVYEIWFWTGVFFRGYRSKEKEVNRSIGIFTVIMLFGMILTLSLDSNLITCSLLLSDFKNARTGNVEVEIAESVEVEKKVATGRFHNTKYYLMIDGKKYSIAPAMYERISKESSYYQRYSDNKAGYATLQPELEWDKENEKLTAKEQVPVKWENVHFYVIKMPNSNRAVSCIITEMSWEEYQAAHPLK
ncbi:MAG: hypothetical protein K2M46_06970 [Lachnospiraceae bacterium]|nr:hypothetical protein [Lachnospiraceae bacterium]